MTTKTVFRIHPTINLARVGTSDEFYLSPETSAGLPLEGTTTTGGLPIKPGTESEFIDSEDLRDANGALKRQAARFRLFAYDIDGPDSYPDGGGTEIVPGPLPDGRVLQEIIWTVHLANKKAAAFCVVPNKGVDAFADGKVPQLRNPGTYGTTGVVDDKVRLQQLMIDPGPRAIASSSTQPVVFNATTPASYGDGDKIVQLLDYPQAFPSTTNDELYEPSGPLDSLGELRTDKKGRLVVLPGKGRTAAQIDEYGVPIPLTGDLNNVGWFDDQSDGPVSATLVFDDGTTEEAFGAWVVCCDPSYAPQIRNVVSIWGDVYDTFVRELNLQPDLYNGATQKFDPEFKPAFDSMVLPVFRASTLQRWTANLPDIAVKAHDAVDRITAKDDPDKTIMAGLNFIRNPNISGETNVGVPLMPLSVGDAGKAFLTVTKTQYFFLEQWSRKKFTPGGTALGPGEQLDFASLSNCLGGRYVPGIEMSYPVRQPDIYITDWRESGSGPFRVKHQKLDYEKARKQNPFLTGGWIPLHNMTDGLQPGDLSKFMAVPWQTDYNSCSIHQTSINTDDVNTSTGTPTMLYWSWPSQRPDAVYLADEVINGVLPPQQWSIRGAGTYSDNPATAATFQDPLQAVKQWDRIGVVLQGTAIPGHEDIPEYYLEAKSRLQVPGIPTNPVLAWPFNANPHKGQKL
ncbi:MAG: LodA/GoxA family CTQ-dependent oxidase [Acidobacteriota bacterium]